MEIPVEQFSTVAWNTIFTTYRKVNQSHWKLPLFEDVQQELMTNGRFAFTGGKSSKLELVRQEGILSVAFIINDTVSSSLQGQLEHMQEEFYRQVRESLGKNL